MPEELEVTAPEVVEEVAAPEVAEVPEESIEDVKAKLAKAEEIATNQRIRAEKAEKAAKEGKDAPSENLSTKDVLFLAKADIHQEDLGEVLDYAKSKKIDASEAYKYLKPILDVRSETRKTAEAANTGASRRSNAQLSDDVLVKNASEGKIPETDADIERLIAAKMKRN